MANPNDWSHFYNNQSSFFTTTTTTTATSVATTASPPAADSPLSPESGRVSKPTRRRSRASRRTPTTLLNTDTSNFRAMVQQFTGGPSAVAFGSSATSGFSLTSTAGANSPAIGDSINSYQTPWQYSNYQNQTVHELQQQQQRPYMFSSSSNPIGYNPNTVVSDGYGGVNESIDGGGGSVAPSSTTVITSTSWLQ